VLHQHCHLPSKRVRLHPPSVPITFLLCCCVHRKSHDDLELITKCALCSKALLNTKQALEGVLGTPGALDTIIASTAFVSDKTKSIILEVLAALCLTDHHEYASLSLPLSLSLSLSLPLSLSLCLCRWFYFTQLTKLVLLLTRIELLALRSSLTLPSLLVNFEAPMLLWLSRLQP
jgi:hypothetical protein